MADKMTKEELHTEWVYRYEERLAILCEPLKPTQEYKDIAAREADAAIKELESQS